jgi:hypothetical protein
MSNVSKQIRRIALAIVMIALGLFLSDDLTVTRLPQLVKQAQAYIGNPLTPMSYAGVARRTTRRVERRDYYGSGGGYPAPYGGYPPPAYGGYPPPYPP